MEHALKMLSMAAGLMITCALIGFGLLAFRESRQLGNELLGSLSSLTQDYGQYEWTRYDGTRVSGGDVINAIRRYQEVMKVSVKVGGSTYLYQGDFRPATNVPGQPGYIRASGTFEGQVLRDEKDEICELRFYEVAE